LLFLGIVDVLAIVGSPQPLGETFVDRFFPQNKLRARFIFSRLKYGLGGFLLPFATPKLRKKHNITAQMQPFRGIKSKRQQL